MDYRCPVCRANIAKRRLSNTVMVKLEIQCPHCKSVVRHNVHRVETAIVMFNFAAILVLAALAYWLRSRDLVVVAVCTALAGAAALPLLEHTYLRTWPRYASMDQSPGKARQN
jgi:DNA-directed RNA polymerase subunit RPC12/RpoP